MKHNTVIHAQEIQTLTKQNQQSNMSIYQNFKLDTLEFVEKKQLIKTIETKNIYPKQYTLNKDYQNPLLDSTKIEKSKKIKSKNEDMFFDLFSIMLSLVGIFGLLSLIAPVIKAVFPALSWWSAFFIGIPVLALIILIIMVIWFYQGGGGI